jgi:hypothetical protein
MQVYGNTFFAAIFKERNNFESFWKNNIESRVDRNSGYGARD